MSVPCYTLKDSLKNISTAYLSFQSLATLWKIVLRIYLRHISLFFLNLVLRGLEKRERKRKGRKPESLAWIVKWGEKGREGNRKGENRFTITPILCLKGIWEERDVLYAIFDFAKSYLWEGWFRMGWRKNNAHNSPEVLQEYEVVVCWWCTTSFTLHTEIFYFLSWTSTELFFSFISWAPKQRGQDSPSFPFVSLLFPLIFLLFHPLFHYASKQCEERTLSSPMLFIFC